VFFALLSICHSDVITITVAMGSDGGSLFQEGASLLVLIERRRRRQNTASSEESLNKV
jgi:hypothetical protein